MFGDGMHQCVPAADRGTYVCPGFPDQSDKTAPREHRILRQNHSHGLRLSVMT